MNSRNSSIRNIQDQKILLTLKYKQSYRFKSSKLQKNTQNYNPVPKVQTIKKQQKQAINLNTVKKIQSNQNQVQIYLNDITDYMVQNYKQSAVIQNYMFWHKDIDMTKRQGLINWLIGVHFSLKFKQKTLHLAVTLIDRFCCNKPISLQRYQLLGITCLVIAAKYQQIELPKIQDYLKQCKKLFTKKDIVQMEAEILKVVEFRVDESLTYQLVQNRINILGCAQKMRQLAYYILNLMIVEFEFCTMKSRYLSSVILTIIQRVASRSNKESEVKPKFNLNKQRLNEYELKIKKIWCQRFGEKHKNSQKKYRSLFGEGYFL